MQIKKFIHRIAFFCVFFAAQLVSAEAEFTVASYNCGALSDHYDYIRAVCMQKLVQQRHDTESETMAQLEKIQNVALKILFSQDEQEREAAEHIWNDEEYDQLFDRITAQPEDEGSINKIWRERSNQIITTYKERPVVIYDEEVKEILFDHARDLTKGQDIEISPEAPLNEWLDVTRRVMAERIFLHQLKYDIICLQEANYLDASVFPEHYEVRFTSNISHSINGVAWNKARFELMQELGDIEGRGFAVKLRDLESGETVLVASGHLAGCDPFKVVEFDSDKGDKNLQAIIRLLDSDEASDADVKIIGMDSNVTAAHPRLALLRDAGYMLDYSNYLDPSCTNPYQVLNTRIDWIAVKGTADIANIPVLGVNLNSPQTNVSDHKPIAARVY